MDRTTYDDEQVAAIVRDKFIAIRVDRDQRPDIDARLQRAVPLIRSQANGWPLTVVLTPAGHVLFKATYLPPVCGQPARHRLRHGGPARPARQGLSPAARGTPAGRAGVG